MSKLLSILLDKQELELTSLIQKLERASGYPSEDVRLASAHSQQVKFKLRQLKLDPEDTTPQELYHALQARFDGDSRRLDRALGVAYDASLNMRLKVAVELVQHCADFPEQWVLKRTAAKRLLRLQPPKKMPKLLGYRSLGSMLKREDVANLYVAIPHYESASWQKALSQKLAALSSADFEMRPPIVVKLPAKYGLERTPLVNVSQLLGAIALDEAGNLENAPVLTIAMQIIEGLQELGSGSSVRSLQKIHPALHWWADAWHLVAGEVHPVSLNLQDVALNHLHDHPFENRILHRGRQALMNHLLERYDKYRLNKDSALAETADELAGKTMQFLKIPSKMKLAPEFSLAE